MSQTTNPSGTAYDDRRWLILAVIGIAQLLVVLDVTIVNIALPSAQKDLHFSDDDRQWVITAYALSFGGLLLLGGRIADLFGRKWTFIAGLLGFAGASAVGGAAQSFGVLVGARALQGAFAAMLAPAALSLLTTTFTDPAERSKAFGIYAGIAGMGGAIGLLLGGALTEALDWRWCLYVSILFAVPAAIAGSRLLHHTAVDSRPRLDLPGTLTASSGLFALVYGLSHGESDGWGDPVTLGLLIGSAVLLAAFVAIERRVAHPLLPLRVVADRARGGSFLAIGDRQRGDLRRPAVPDLLPPEHEGPHRARDRSRVPADELHDRAHRCAHEHTVAAPHRPASARAHRHAHRRARHGAPDANRHRHRLRHARPALADPDRRRLRPDPRRVVPYRDRRRARARQRRRLGDGQYLPADRRLDRDRPVEHASRSRRRPGSSPTTARRPRCCGRRPSRATRPPSGGQRRSSRRARWSPARSCARTHAPRPSTPRPSPSRRTRKGPTMQTAPPTPPSRARPRARCSGRSLTSPAAPPSCCSRCSSWPFRARRVRRPARDRVARRRGRPGHRRRGGRRAGVPARPRGQAPSASSAKDRITAARRSGWSSGMSV